MGPTPAPDAAGNAPVGLPAVSIGLSLYTGQRSAHPGPRYADLVPIAQAAEAAGFDAFWVSEHHDFDGAYLPSPLVALGAAAAATRSLTLGTGVVLGPLTHPLRIAEDAAVVDHLSGGRLVLGLGLGYITREFAMFGVPISRRGRQLDETVAVVRRALTGERFSYHGTVFSFDTVRVRPGSVRPEGIPIWLGGYAENAIRRAGRLGDGHLVGRGSPELLATATTLLGQVRDPGDESFTMAMNAALIGDDVEAGGGSARIAFSRQQRTYERCQEGTDLYDAPGTAEPVEVTDLGEGPIDRYVQLTGDATALAEGMLALLEGNKGWARQHLALRALFPDEDLDVLLRRIDYLGRMVLPEVRRRLATPGAAPGGRHARSNAGPEAP